VKHIDDRNARSVGSPRTKRSRGAVVFTMLSESESGSDVRAESTWVIRDAETLR
jgi:hypothetical protein